VGGLQHDRERAVAALAAAKDRLRQVTEGGLGAAAGAAAAAPPATWTADASKLKDYVEEVLRLEGEKDALAVELQVAQQALQQQQQQQQPAEQTDQLQKQQQVFELQLQRDQAVAAAQRLRMRLEDLFGPGAADPLAAANRPAASKAAPPGRLTGREAELLSTVDNLRAALERAMASSTPTSRFMNEFERRKRLAKEAEALRSEVKRLKQQLSAAQADADGLAAANGELQRQVQQLKEAAAAAAAAAAGGTAAGNVAAAALRRQVEQLAAALQQRERETAALRATADALRAQLATGAPAGRRPGGAGGEASPLTGHDAAAAPGPTQQQQAAALEQRVAALERENAALLEELGAFDSAFWEELEELVRFRRSRWELGMTRHKRCCQTGLAVATNHTPPQTPQKLDRHRLGVRCSEQEETIAGLRAQVAAGHVAAAR
jgi:hypothetical protein